MERAADVLRHDFDEVVDTLIDVHRDRAGVDVESELDETQIDLAADITLTCAAGGTAQRNSTTALTLNGHGHSITQTCANSIALIVLNNAPGGGASTFQNVTITGGNATGSVTLTDSTVNATTDPNRVSQLITVEVRKQHQRRPHQRRPHQPPD